MLAAASVFNGVFIGVVGKDGQIEGDSSVVGAKQIGRHAEEGLDLSDQPWQLCRFGSASGPCLAG